MTFSLRLSPSAQRRVLQRPATRHATDMNGGLVPPRRLEGSHEDIALAPIPNRSGYCAITPSLVVYRYLAGDPLPSSLAEAAAEIVQQRTKAGFDDAHGVIFLPEGVHRSAFAHEIDGLLDQDIGVLNYHDDLADELVAASTPRKDKSDP